MIAALTGLKRPSPRLWRLGRLMGLRRSTAGSVALETAFTLPIFLVVVFGIFEFSMVLLTYCNVTTACSQAARYASLHSGSSLSPATTTQLQSMVASKLFAGASVTPNNVTVTYLTPGLAAGTNTVGDLVMIKASWSQTVTLPFTSANSFTIGSQDVRSITR